MNRLADETSPYLRQHADNPVDWFPFSDEALARAREADRPLFISIGYSACHWCHVMAHESFEDEEIASLLNSLFVPVKVDREERPDVDAVYLEAVQSLSGRGGWPLSVFATPDGRPFFGGTYFPKKAAHGTPGFGDVLAAVAEAWREKRQEIDDQAKALTAAVDRRLGGGQQTSPPPHAVGLFEAARERVAAIYDPVHPGFGAAPKFPQAPMLELLLHSAQRGDERALEMATSALLAMASGGIYDQLAGGFARYSVDRAWQVPHFEKMLYDQASLARCYLHAFQLTGDRRHLQVLEETLGYVLGTLRGEEGGFYSAMDADSEGVEGRYYVWTAGELVEVLGEQGARLAADWYGAGMRGNFEHGTTVLHRAVRGDLIRPPEVEEIRRQLLAARSLRVPPATDDKVLCEWNAMTVSVLAEAAMATDNRAWRQAAVDNGEFLLARLRRPDGRFLRSYWRGSARHLAVAADYAWLVDCFTRLAELTGAARHAGLARSLADDLIELFSAPDGGWFTTGSDADPLVVRPRELFDGVTPSAGSVAASALARLGALTGETRFTRRSEETVAAASGALQEAPAALCHLVEAALFLTEGPIEIVVGRRADLARSAARPFLPRRVLVVGEEIATPLSEGRRPDAGYVCRRGVCLAPVDDEAALAAAIAEADEGSRAA